MNIYQNLLNQELNTIKKTKQVLMGYSDHLPKLINLLIRLSFQHRKKQSFELNTSSHFYHDFSFYTYFHLHYQVRSIMVLTDRGYYTQAIQILRNILELIIKLKYCTKYKDRTESVWLNIRHPIEGKITIERMFRSIAPDLIDSYDLLSGFTHGGSSQNLFKVDLGKKIGAQANAFPGTCYDESGASFVINQLYAYLGIYLSHFSTSFPDSYQTLPKELTCEMQQCLDICKYAKKSHISVRPESKKWHNAIDQLNCIV